jgi:hypothetical protein
MGTIEVAPILDSHEQQPKRDDPIFNLLVEEWSKMKENREGSTNSMILAGILALLQFTCYKDLRSLSVKECFAFHESRRLCHFLDSIPLLPKHSTDDSQHPFPTHFLVWTDEEVE